MNIKKFIVVFITVLVSQNIFANQCALLSTIRVPINKDVRQLILVEHNGKRLSQPLPNFNAIASRTLRLAPGLHKFTGLSGDHGLPCGANIQTKYRKSQKKCHNSVNISSNLSSLFEFTINIEANKRYDLISKRTYPKNVVKSKRFHPELLKTSNYQCQSDNKNIIYAALPIKSQLISQHNLQPKLQSEFNQLMLEIANYYQKLDLPYQQFNITRAMSNDYIYGLDGKTAQNNNTFGIEVTGIGTASQASHIGLKIGDLITKINGKTLTSTEPMLLAQTISQLKSLDQYSITVKRADHVVILKDQYRPKKLVGFQLALDLSSIGIANKEIQKIEN